MALTQIQIIQSLGGDSPDQHGPQAYPNPRARMRMLPPSSHVYPDLHVRLHPFVCRITAGSIKPTEHQAVQWSSHDRLQALKWAEADVAVVQSYLDYRMGKQGI